MRKFWNRRPQKLSPEVSAAADESLATAKQDVEYQKRKQRAELDLIRRLKAARERNQLADSLARALSQHGHGSIR